MILAADGHETNCRQLMGKQSYYYQLTSGSIARSLVSFTLPMMLGALLQQAYNLTDTWLVGRYIGPEALAAVGSSYTLMVFLISILWGLAMGSGTVVSLLYGAGEQSALRRSVFLSFSFVGVSSLLLTVGMLLGLDPVLRFLKVPAAVVHPMRAYLWIVCAGIPLVSLYNYYAAMLRAVGDSLTPLYFLVLSVVLNVVLDIAFIWQWQWGIEGAAWATVIAQGFSAFGLVGYACIRRPELCWRREDCCWDRACLKDILSFSSLTCLQQSVMNFGILLIQGLVNSFGAVVMAAFAVAVKIDAFAYMPVQEFGNAFSTFIAQNYGAGEQERIHRGVRVAFGMSVLFSCVVSVLVFVFAGELMQLFILPEETDILQVGICYLRIEGAFYAGIGLLFLLYGYYRAIRMPGMSVILTLLSLGTRVMLSYLLASIPQIGVEGIWWSIPIGWFLADAVGIWYYLRRRDN